MPETLTITLSRAALSAAVDAILLDTFQWEFTDCRNLRTLVAECGSGCSEYMAFLRAARDAGIDIQAQACLHRDQHHITRHGGQSHRPWIAPVR